MKRLFTLAQRGVACFGVYFNSRGRVGVGRLLEIGRHGAPTNKVLAPGKSDKLYPERRELSSKS